MQIYKNEEDQYIGLAKKSRCVLSLIHTRDTKNNNHQGNSKFSNHNYQIQDIKDSQHKHISMT